MIKKQSKSISFYRRRYFGRSPRPIFRMATCDQSRNFQKISSHIINSQKNRAAVGSFGGSVLEVAKAIFGTHPPAGGWPLLPLSQGFSAILLSGLVFVVRFFARQAGHLSRQDMRRRSRCIKMLVLQSSIWGLSVISYIK